MNLSEIFAGQPTPERWRMLGEYLKSQTIKSGPGIRVNSNTASGTVISAAKPQPPPPQQDPPLWPRFVKDGANWMVTVSRGVVTDRVTKTGDAVVIHEIPNQLSGGDLALIGPITNGQAVYVKVEVKETGEIGVTSGDPCSIVIANDGEASVHYDPPCGDETSGTAGTMYYKLAVFNVTGDIVTPDYVMAGSNIDHYRELPMFIKAGGTADVFKEFDLTAGKYKTRGITAGTGITVTENTDDIEIKLDSDGADLNLEVYQSTFGHDGSGHLTISQSTTPEAIYYWRAGLFVGTADPDGGSPPVGLLTRKVSYNSIP